MSEYKGNTVSIDKPAAEIADKFADLTVFADALENIPEQDRAKVGNISFDTDSITIDTAQVGKVMFRITERTPSRVSLEAVGSPVPLKLWLDMLPQSETVTDLTPIADVDIPFMLKPMIGPYLQKAVDNIGEFIAKLAAK